MVNILLGTGLRVLNFIIHRDSAPLITTAGSMIPRCPVGAIREGTGINGDLPMEFVLGKTPDLGGM
jgi:hypothetical protein